MLRVDGRWKGEGKLNSTPDLVEHMSLTKNLHICCRHAHILAQVVSSKTDLHSVHSFLLHTTGRPNTFHWTERTASLQVLMDGSSDERAMNLPDFARQKCYDYYSTTWHKKLSLLVPNFLRISSTWPNHT
jgi:hypothetical protein